MSFGDHLEELRHRLLLALVFPIPAAIILFFFSNTLVNWLLLPVHVALRANGLPQRLTNLAPQEMIVTQLKISLIFAVILSAPWVLWQAWRFVGPGLYAHEQRFVRLLIPGSLIMTLIGAALLYYVMLPLMLNVLIAMSSSVSSPAAPEADPRVASNPPGRIEVLLQSPAEPHPGDAWVIWPDLGRAFAAVPGSDGSPQIIELRPPLGGTIAQEYRVSETISFILLLFMGVAVAFQMPLVVLLLGWLGLASVDWLRERRKFALFICGIAAAVLTPTADMISMLILMVPLYALYELGILLLVIAPAGRVAEGQILRWPRRPGGADKSPKSPGNSAKPAQAEQIVARTPTRAQPGRQLTDGEEIP